MIRPIVGVLAAIGITTAMDAGGMAAFSALPLLPLLLLFWRLERHTRGAVGFTWGRAWHYALAVLHPLAVLGTLAAVAFAAGATDLSNTRWDKAGLNAATVAIATILVAIVTEEGFFRGWLFASLERAGKGRGAVLAWSSVAFALWHLSAVAIAEEFRLPASQIGVFMANATVMGLVWGMLRSWSGSIVVASVAHGLWNGIAYVGFGVGGRTGALGIRDTAFYGPESGLLGLALNGAFAVILWRAWRRGRSPLPHPAPGAATS
jgi:membrane protease YdiL (CAAX protease family)